MSRELDDELTTRKISIIYGSVQMGRALNWKAAREELAASIYDMFGPRVTGIGRVAEARERHLDRAATAPVERTERYAWIWVADQGHTPWCAQEGDHGLKTGDLAIARDAHEPGAFEWTVDVKCKILSVDGRQARIRVTTSKAVQFTRGQETVVGIELLRPRPRNGR